VARGIRIVGAEAGEGEDNVAPRSAEKAWSGRLGSKTARRVEDYTTSIAVDRRLYP
jgi:hypothetical protein